MIERLARIALLPILLLLAIACGDDRSSGPVRVPVGSVTVTPGEQRMLVGEQVRLAATPRTLEGEPLPDRSVSWSSEAPAVAGIAPDGTVTALAAGTTFVVATSEGRAGRARVIVSAPAPLPTVTSLSPDGTVAGPTIGTTVTIRGTGFTTATTVRVNGLGRETEYASDRELRTILGADDVATPRVLAISAHTPAPGGGTSASLPFTVHAHRPAPTVTSLTPAGITVGWAGNFTLTVRGTGFLADSRVTWNGTPREAAVVSGTEIRLVVTSADVAVAGAAEVAVVTPAPGGGRAAAVFTVYPVAVARVDMSSPWGAGWTWGQDRLPLHAVARSATGAELPVRIDRWTVSDERIATLAPTGAGSVALYGVAPGHVTVTAAAGDVAAQRQVAVFAAPTWDLLFDVDHPAGRRIMRWTPGHGVMPVALPTGVVSMDPSPSPDGARLAFIGMRGDDAPELFVANADGSGARVVAGSDAAETAPSWSPDGLRIAFASNRAGSLDIYTVAPDGSSLARLTWASGANPTPGSGNAAGSPAWSPEGDRIAYTVREGARHSLWIMNADGSGKRPLTVVPSGMSADDLEPAWHPNGRAITVRRTLHPSRQTMLVSLSPEDGSPVFNFGDQVDGTAPAYSPDGRWLTYTSTPTTLPGLEGGALVALPLLEALGRRVVMDPYRASGTSVRNAVWVRRR